jgi:hypothetical protein
MSIVNNHTIVIAKIKTANGNTRYVARILSKWFKHGTQARKAYTFTNVPFMTREEAIMDLEQNLGYGTYPEVKHA